MRLIDADALAVDIKECIEAKYDNCEYEQVQGLETALECIDEQLTAQPERLTDDDFETIRIHLNACKEKLCNQRRWKEAEEYQRIIDRFMAFASVHLERKRGKWIRITQGAMPEQYICPFCHRTIENYGVEELLSVRYPYCHCGADMRGDDDAGTISR